MAGRVVLFGATGYTGGLVAAALVRRGELPLLVGRDPRRLARLAATLERDGRRPAAATADVGDQSSLARVVAPRDVLVSTVGPFVRLGEPAVRVAVAAGAVYLDSTGEPPFLRRVFEEHGPRATASGAVLLPAFGYDYVPGNLAGALALRAAGAAATRVDVGYFRTGEGGVSGGTAASAAGVLLEPSFAWRSGRLQPERPGARTRAFASLGGRTRRALSVGGSEHLTLPRLHPGLDTVGVYLGWAGPLTPLAAAVSGPLAAAARLPVLRRGLDAVQARTGPRPGQGPDAAARAGTGSLVAAEAFDAAGRLLARTVLAGPGPYDLTAELLADAAVHAQRGGVSGSGALGPVAAFGLDVLRERCAALGLHEVPAPD